MFNWLNLLYCFNQMYVISQLKHTLDRYVQQQKKNKNKNNSKL